MVYSAVNATRSNFFRVPRLMPFLLTILWTVLAAYSGLVIFAWLCADRMIFPRPAPSYHDAPNQNKLPAADGNEITAVFLPNPTAPFVILYSLGNGEDLGTVEDSLREFQKRGWAVFAYDNPGYGTSTGTPTEASCYSAIGAAYSYLTTLKNVPPERIVLYGRSLGSGPAVELASLEPVGGLILQGAYLSTFRVITHWKLLPWDKFDNLAKITHVHAPLLSIHGRLDETVPFWHGEELFNAYPGPKDHLWLDNAAHNNILEVAPAEYWEAIEKFRQKLIAALPPGSPAAATPAP